jgi:proline racemase
MTFSASRLVHAVDSHTAGEPTRVITGGIPPIPGATMADKRAHLAAHFDDLREALVAEPRGHEAMVLAFLTPPVSADAAVGVVFANDVGYLGMCGHGSIGVATVLVSLGMVEAVEPVTTVVLDTPPGPVQAEVAVAGGRPGGVRLRNVPSFLLESGVAVPVEGRGKVRCDLAWGGNWFAIVRADEVGEEVAYGSLGSLLACATSIRASLARQGVQGFDPATGRPHAIDHVEIYRPETAAGVTAAARTFTLCPGRAWDRSPCGTGTSAKMAAMFAHGELGLGQRFVNRSVIGTEFTGVLLEETAEDGRRAVVPQIEGRAHITGLQQFVLDPDDPLRFGIARFARDR